MKVGSSLVVLCLLAATAFGSVASSVVINVLPQGDGMIGKDRCGYGYPWEWSGFDSGATPNWSGHWYDSPNGSWRDVYMQIAIDSLPAADQITNATLFINISSVNGSGCNLNHASNSSAATGYASQTIGGDEFVTTISSGSGWVGIDVTNFIKNDVQNGYSWSSFQFCNIGYSGVTFGSGESTDAPYLSVVPEPATMALLGLGGLFLSRRKK